MAFAFLIAFFSVRGLCQELVLRAAQRENMLLGLQADLSTLRQTLSELEQRVLESNSLD